MRLHAMLYILYGLTLSPIAQARPVSYTDSWTVMLRNDAEQNSAHIHYTFDRRHSLGLRLRYDRENDAAFTGAQLNRLVKRWNETDSQANLYGHAAIGIVKDEAPSASARADDMSFFLAASGDWETRRYFTSAAIEYWNQGRFGDELTYHSRLGIAPYIAGAGALHTWIMVEGHARPENDTPLTATALLRFFKGPSLLEIGVDMQGEPLLNYIHRF